MLEERFRLDIGEALLRGRRVDRGTDGQGGGFLYLLRPRMVREVSIRSDTAVVNRACGSGMDVLP